MKREACSMQGTGAGPEYGLTPVQTKAPVGNQDLQPGEILHREAPASTFNQLYSDIARPNHSLLGTDMAWHNACGVLMQAVHVVVTSDRTAIRSRHQGGIIQRELLRRA